MTIGGFVFLAAYTTRSRAYAQAMAEAGLAPERVMLFGDQAAAPAGGTHSTEDAMAAANLDSPKARSGTPVAAPVAAGQNVPPLNSAAVPPVAAAHFTFGPRERATHTLTQSVELGAATESGTADPARGSQRMQ